MVAQVVCQVVAHLSTPCHLVEYKRARLLTRWGSLYLHPLQLSNRGQLFQTTISLSPAGISLSTLA